MITHAEFAVEPWVLRERSINLDFLAQTESVLALSNGHIGLRGNLDEGEPLALPGTYLNGFYERRPLPYAEVAYGQPEQGQTVVNVTNGKVIRLLVSDEPFDIRYGQLRGHERTLDFRAGTLQREVEWNSPAGQTVRVRSTRFVSFTQRAVAAIAYEVEPVDETLRVVVQSELVTNEPQPAMHEDPRAAAALQKPLVSEWARAHDSSAVLVHRTRASELRMAAGMIHAVSGPEEAGTYVEAEEDLARLTVSAVLKPGETLRLVKFISYGWSSQRTMPAVRDQVAAALAEAIHTGWETLLAEQREYLDEFWNHADVRIDGDPELQQAVRFALWHTLQAGARAERRAIPAKGLTGPGYDGHAFWDTESFVLPVLTYTAPDAAADALRWRHSTLDTARERARQLGLQGAAFPWRTIHGEECSGYWPAGTGAFHIAGDIADAVIRYENASGDDEFARTVGLELLVETARLWRSLGHHDGRGDFRIEGVTGPDEYSAIADNNVYTNLIAQRNLLAAAAAASRHPDAAQRLGVDTEEAASWRDSAEAMFIPYDEELGVHPQSENFLEHARWPFESYDPDRYPLLLHAPYFDLYRKQVVKQADLVLALFVCGDRFTAEEKDRDFDYYEKITVRDSSLSACTQAIVAAEVGHLTLAYDYYGEAALMDLEDREQNTRDGVHIASLAGAWLGAVAGFGGMRDHGGKLSFSPRLPEAITRVAFRIIYAARSLRVDVGPRETTYELLEGEPLTISHDGEELTVSGAEKQTRPTIVMPRRHPPPEQPPGRAPQRRMAEQS
ncbi:MAG: glycoside hydrolase family 65 protein [Actinomycetota bacterium]|nr:glycoside hydrolase family 65 protein [Actinomycetota bacterium]